MADWWAAIAQNTAGRSRTDVLRALVWPNALLLTALVAAASKNAPMFILILLSIMLVLFMLLYAAAYIFFGLKDPNLLRSERFNIEKLAIEHGVYGDSLRGLAPDPSQQQLLGRSNDVPEGGRK